MKKIIMILSTISLGLWGACSSDLGNESDIDKSVIYQEQVEELLSYLYLSDDVYLLELSKSEAIAKGISEKIYDEMLSSIEQTNIAIEQTKEQGGELFLFDPQMELKDDINRVQTRSESNPATLPIYYGVVNMSGSDMVGQATFTPQKNTLYIQAHANSPLWSVTLSGGVNMIISGNVGQITEKTAGVTVGNKMTVNVRKNSGNASVATVVFGAR